MSRRKYYEIDYTGESATIPTININRRLLQETTLLEAKKTATSHPFERTVSALGEPIFRSLHLPLSRPRQQLMGLS